jgi:hypothetical protein
MTVPREFYDKEVNDGILDLMYADIGTEFALNSTEPIYYGHPDYVSNWPCLISVPADTEVRAVESPYISDQEIQHKIVYLFQAKRATQSTYTEDPYLTAKAWIARMLDWLAYATVNDRFPLRVPANPSTSDNWLVHFYGRPWIGRVEGEYQGSIREFKEEENLFAPQIEFTTVCRIPFRQLV